MRLAEEFEAREGRDLRGFLDFLAVRAETDSEAQAATAAEGHDGVRIMTVHNAKGLEFDVVAVPDLARSLLAGTRPPLLTIGREPEPRVGMQLRRLGAASVNLYAYADLCEEAKERDAEEGLRLFHVAATRARRHLILSGVVKPEAGGETKPATPVIERIVDGLGVDRENDSSVQVPAPEPRQGLDASFDPAEIAVRMSLPSPERATELTRTSADETVDSPAAAGPAPLVERRPAAVPHRPLSYSAIAAFEECAYRFYAERILDLGESSRSSHRIAEGITTGTARGAAVHSLLEWSAANDWREPPGELARRHAIAAGLDEAAADGLLDPIRAWLGSALLAERAQAQGARVRAEVPLLLGASGAVLRGSIDLLVERDGAPPLVVDYKTDRLGNARPADRAGHYETQRDIYALAVSESRNVPEVEVAYVFLERPDDPVVTLLEQEEIDTGRKRLVAAIERIEQGDFPPASPDHRTWDLCRGCPALGRTCSGPPDDEPAPPPADTARGG
jgi:ATP-dependent helicase/nuclease subunit A